ncbi:sedoheptulose 7-phosphate cyclase [Streptomyces sp. MMG1533]|uniref:sedoheptulose 7-phosphate cyclase n=1 Tax=Streptomyces sp. MMG1533 TaxID=1415546 RepID=UPI0006AEA9BA|nr:sedoheptulose 7-phosphate cyclase [Streptomyces sp. MMG1533]
MTLQVNEPVDERCEHRWAIPAAHERCYEVVWQPNLLEPHNSVLGDALRSYGGNTPVVIIDRTVDSHHGAKIRDYFRSQEIAPHYLVRDLDESKKGLTAVEELAAALDALPIRRRTDPLVAIGGGVLLDVVGFLASIYRRGMPYIRIPTTLVGLIDAGIGVKTGVNAGRHKNRLGTYWAPDRAFLPPEFLPTLDTRHIRNGVAEIIKLAIVRDRELFALLEGTITENGCAGFVSHPQLESVCVAAVSGMLEELAPNLWEHDLRRPVDFGHTFSPALELGAEDMLHGESVACDMALCAAFSYNRELLSWEEFERIVRTLRQSGLPTVHQYFTEPVIASSLAEAIRHRNGMQHIPVPHSIGQAVFIEDSTVTEWIAARDLCLKEESNR